MNDNVCTYCLQAGHRASHCPRRPVRESLIERHLVAAVRAKGGEVRKVKWIGRRGAPDRLVMLPGFRFVADKDLTDTGRRWLRDAERLVATEVGLGISIWVELKAPGKKPEPHQLREHARMRAMGQRVEVIDSIEGVEELLA